MLMLLLMLLRLLLLLPLLLLLLLMCNSLAMFRSSIRCCINHASALTFTPPASHTQLTGCLQRASLDGTTVAPVIAACLRLAIFL